MKSNKPNPNKSHPGIAGRKRAVVPEFLKKFRASESERAEFTQYMTGNARADFLKILAALKK